MKEVEIGLDILFGDNVDKFYEVLIRVFSKDDSSSLVDDLEALITPNLEKINEVTEQENDARFLAYSALHSLVKHFEEVEAQEDATE